MSGAASMGALIDADTAFISMPDCIRAHARMAPERVALRDEAGSISYAELDALMDRVAAALQRDGVGAGEVIAVGALNCVRYVVLFLGALRAGVVVAPLAPSVTAEDFGAMVADAEARLLFVDAATTADRARGVPRVALGAGVGDRAFDDWLAPPGAAPAPVVISPEMPFNIIYSSGTTGTPKGIVQSHGMRWAHVRRGTQYDYGPDGATLIATPLYSNTTLVVLFPTLGFGGALVLMAKFDAGHFLQLAERWRVTHTMLVPVQYQRIMAHDAFAAFDLSSFRMKFCTSAPFRAELKSDVLARWPGGLTEFYGMTEGGGTCILEAHRHRDKLHTVGRPAPGHDIRLIDEEGNEVARGAAGEVVGHSPAMMTAYHRQPDKTREVLWFDATGKRFIRTGDVGRFDEDGFLTLIDRRKDMIISGGFNLYPSELEAVLMRHPAVQEAAVVGIASEHWGETPVAFVVLRAVADVSPEELRAWFNERVGKTQRLADLRLVEALPRSAIGKVLKRSLRDAYTTI